MTRTNQAFNYDTTAQEAFHYPLQNRDKPRSYIGGPEIVRLVKKTEDGKAIEDFTKPSIAPDTANAFIEDTNPSANNRPIINLSQISPKIISHSIVLKKWHGYVKSIDGNEFTAVLTDQSGATPDITASFSRDEVSEGERDLVCENAFFDWVVSRERKLHGTIENKDFLIFRRIPIWKKSDLEIKSAKVEAFNDWLNAGTSTAS